MITECPICEARVESKIIATHQSFSKYENAPMKYTLLECTTCKTPQLVEQYLLGYDPKNDSHWSKLKRNWPEPEFEIPFSVPDVTRKSLEEAERCIKAKAFIASAAMSGRALEGICRHFKTKSKYLGAGIKELQEKNIIDLKLFEWSKELHIHRNIAAHADDIEISEEDAKDLLDFVIAICEYIFVLGEKFKDFQERQAVKKEKSNG